MLKKTINYTDYNGMERKEDFILISIRQKLQKWSLVQKVDLLK